MAIYTKTGDKGETTLFGGKRVLKSDLRIEALGEIDELNSLIGVIVSQNQRSKIKDQKYISKIKNELLGIQGDLFKISSFLASIPTIRYTLDAKRLKGRVKEFEKMIGEFIKELPEIRNFILPGGGRTGAFLHFARSICRRAERRIITLSQKEKVNPLILIYFNRLSDLIFVFARFINYKEKEKEIIIG